MNATTPVRGEEMPTISRFFGIAIRMYRDDHAPPHFHAAYAGDDAQISIDTLDLLAGRLPRRAMTLVLEWAMLHRSELRQNWDLAQAHQEALPIAPLDQED